MINLPENDLLQTRLLRSFREVTTEVVESSSIIFPDSSYIH